MPPSCGTALDIPASLRIGVAKHGAKIARTRALRMIASGRCRALAVDLAKGDPESRALDGDRRRATRVSRVVGGDLMRRISRMVMGAAASAALLGGIGGAALA